MVGPQNVSRLLYSGNSMQMATLAFESARVVMEHASRRVALAVYVDDIGAGLNRTRLYEYKNYTP